MKYIIVLFVSVFSLMGCNPQGEDVFATNGSVYRPIMMDVNQMRSNGISFTNEAIPMKNPGKILSYKEFVFVTDIYRGIHIINNSNPNSPIKEGYITIPGVTDVHIKNGILYANNSIDMVAIDLLNRTVLKRIENVFPEETSTPDGMPFLPEYQPENRPKNFVIVEWIKVS